MVSKLMRFFTVDIWRIRLRNYPRPKSFLLNMLRIIVLSVRSFIENVCWFRASALTFYTLLSVVPVIAMMFAIAKGFGLDQTLETQLMTKLKGQEQVAERIVSFAQSLLQNTSGGLIAGVGVALLFYSIVSLLGSIEQAFNHIWGVKISRSWGRKFSDYLSMMLVSPILLIISSSATVLISTEIEKIISNIEFLRPAAGIIAIGLRLLPFITLWIFFIFLFMFMPNTKVNFSSALFGGIIAGTIFQMVQWAYVAFQIGAAKYNAIYGSFAAIPLFLVWLQTSWVIVLFGAELSFAFQNVHTYEFEPDCLNVSQSYKKKLSLLVMYLLVKDFMAGKSPRADEIAHRLDMPIRLLRDILFDLEAAGLITEVKSDGRESGYQPRVAIENLTIKNVLDSLENRGHDNVPISQTKELEEISKRLKDFSDQLEKSPANVPIKDL